MDCTPPPSLQSVPCFSTYRSTYLVAGANLAKAPWGDIALQAFVQGPSVAESHRVDGHHLDLGRSIRSERRTAAGTTGPEMRASAFPSTHGLAIG